MSIRNEYLSTGMTFAEWTHQRTLRSNGEKLDALRSTVASSLEEAATTVDASMHELRGELVYQARAIREEVQQAGAEVALAIQKMSDFLGAELSAIRWAVERHINVSEQILQVLRNSLSNESRQYFDQGIECYDTLEFGFAAERFSKALEADRTNYFAYQYLGFIAANNNQDEAIRNFELATKFAKTKYHWGLAISHLALCHFKKGDLVKAAELARDAVEANPQMAKFKYELAGYHARAGTVNEAISSLRQTIENDWTYWGIVTADSAFDPVRSDVLKLLDELRERERRKARQALDTLKDAIHIAEQIGVDAIRLNELETHAIEFEEKYRLNNVYIHREVLASALRIRKHALQTAAGHVTKVIKELDDQVECLRNAIWKTKQAFQKWEPTGGGYFALWFMFQVLCTQAFAVVMILNGYEGATSSIMPVFAFSTTATAIALTAWTPSIVNKWRFRKHVKLPTARIEEQIRNLENKTRPDRQRLAGWDEKIRLELEK